MIAGHLLQCVTPFSLSSCRWRSHHNIPHSAGRGRKVSFWPGDVQEGPGKEPWEGSRFAVHGAGRGIVHGMGTNVAALSGLGTVPWDWCTWMLTPTPETEPWGRRSTTGPRSGAAWRKGCWTAAAWSRSASEAPPMTPILTSTARTR